MKGGRRNVVLLLLGVVSLVLSWWIGHLPGGGAPSPQKPEKVITSTESPRPAPAKEPRVLLPIAEVALSLNREGSTVQDDLSTLEVLLTEYRRRHGGNPVGENEEIAAVLMGKNPGSLAYLPSAGAFLDAGGRLVDRWGTPYVFHALSAERMQIRSAGPDRVLHTADDAGEGP